jgi:branched-chain amino acid transport system permease protein
MIDFLVFSVTVISIWSVVALSLNLQFGLAGLVNFGQVLPFALGAYGVAVAAVHGLPIWAGMMLGLGVALAASVLVLLPVRRLAQDYWALVTLGAAELFRLAMINLPQVAGGNDGATVPRIGSPVEAMAISLAMLAAAVALTWRIDRSPFGRVLRIIREDEVLAASLGRSPFRFQLVVTALAWLMAAAAGIVFAHFVGYVAPAAFGVAETFMVWTALIVGGPGSMLGAIIGTAFIQIVSVGTRFAAQWSGLPYELVANLRLAVFGLLLVLAFLFRPQGLLPERRVVTDAGDR